MAPAFPEDPGSVPSIHKEAQLSLSPTPGDLMSSGLGEPQAHHIQGT